MSLFDRNHEDGNPCRPSATDPMFGQLGKDEARCAGCGVLLLAEPLPCDLCAATFCSPDCHAEVHDAEAEEAQDRQPKPGTPAYHRGKEDPDVDF